jgi:hypothetical protein
MSPKPSGRPPKNPRETDLETENERLRRQNARLQDRVDTIDRLLGVASDMLKDAWSRLVAAAARPPKLSRRATTRRRTPTARRVENSKEQGR